MEHEIMSATILPFSSRNAFSECYGRAVGDLEDTALRHVSAMMQSDLPLSVRADPHAALYAALTAAGILNVAATRVRKMAEKYAAETGLQMPRR